MKSLIIYARYDGLITDYILDKTIVGDEKLKETVQAIKEYMNSDVFEIVREEKVPDKAFEYKAFEKNEVINNILPKISNPLKDINDYDIIFVGCHLSNYLNDKHLDQALIAQLKDLDLSNKIIMPFGIGDTNFSFEFKNEIIEYTKSAKVKDALFIGNNVTNVKSHVIDWLINENAFVYRLNNNILIPRVGIGTFLLKPEQAYKSVNFALKSHYFLVDTASFYGNEVSVGRAIKDSNIQRENIFISTKIWPSEYRNYENIKKCISRLGVDYVDLMFLHQPTKNWKKGYRNLIKAYKEGLIKSIGLSNFSKKQIQYAIDNFEIKPQVVQLECNPLCQQDDLRQYLEKEDIYIMSWFPFGGKGHTKELLEHPMIREVKEDEHYSSTSQVIMKWHLDHNFIVIPGSKSEEHIASNLSALRYSDTHIKEENMEKIKTMDTKKKRLRIPSFLLSLIGLYHPKHEK